MSFRVYPLIESVLGLAGCKGVKTRGQLGGRAQKDEKEGGKDRWRERCHAQVSSSLDPCSEPLKPSGNAPHDEVSATGDGDFRVQ